MTSRNLALKDTYWTVTYQSGKVDRLFTVPMTAVQAKALALRGRPYDSVIFVEPTPMKHRTDAPAQPGSYRI